MIGVQAVRSPSRQDPCSCAGCPGTHGPRCEHCRSLGTGQDRGLGLGRSVGELAEAAGGGWGPVSTCPSGNAAEEGAGVRTGASGPQKATPGRTQLAWPQTVCTGVCMWEDPGQRSVPSATSQDMPGDPSSTWGFTSSWAGVYTHHQHRRPAGWPSARGWSSLRGPLERQPSGRLAGAGGLPGLSAPPAAPPSPGKTGTDTVELVLLGQQLLRPLWGVRPRKAMASSRALTATPRSPCPRTEQRAGDGLLS